MAFVLSAQGTEHAGLDPIALIALCGVGAVVGAGSHLVGRVVKLGNAQSTYVVRWAMSETTGVMGFTAWFLTGNWYVLGGMGLLSLVLLASHAPTGQSE